MLRSSAHRLRKHVHGLCGILFGDLKRQSATRCTLASDTLLVRVLPGSSLLRMSCQEPHHLQVLFSLKPIYQRFEGCGFVLVHLLQALPCALQLVAGQCEITRLRRRLVVGVDALDGCTHDAPEAGRPRPSLAFKQGENVRPEFDYWHVPDLIGRLEVNFFHLAVDDRGHLRRHEKLP